MARNQDSNITKTTEPKKQYPQKRKVMNRSTSKLPSRTPTHRTKREKEKIIDSKVPAGSGFILGTLERGNGSPTVFEKASKLNHQVTGMNAKFHQGLGALLNTWHLSYWLKCLNWEDFAEWGGPLRVGLWDRTPSLNGLEMGALVANYWVTGMILQVAGKQLTHGSMLHQQCNWFCAICQWSGST